MSHITDFSIDPGAAAEALEAAFSQLEQSRFSQTLWSGRWTDPTRQLAVANRLGWLNAVTFIAAQLPRIEAFAERVRASGLTDVVLLGMGGSSLAPEVFRRVLGRDEATPRFHVLDSTDPDAVRAALAHAPTSLFIIASKSGTTIEPNAMAAAARQRLEAAGISAWSSRLVAITDDQTALHRRALDDHYLDVFVNPSDVGGRYSALTFFGMVPAALMGIPLGPIVERARAMVEACRSDDPRTNPGVALGALMGAAVETSRDKLTLLVPDRLAPFGLWVEQLVAESTGKERATGTRTGIVPITGGGSNLAIADDRMAVAVRVGGEGPDESAIARVKAARVPLITIDIPDLRSLGAEFFRWEIATATAGRLLDVNPFDEPNVGQAKEATQALLRDHVAGRAITVTSAHDEGGIGLTLSRAAREHLGSAGAERFLDTLSHGDYFALLAYLPPDDRRLAAALEDMCRHVEIATGCATTLGYGPRYLHSTGQLHKGGRNNGVFLVVTAPADQDLPIPDAPYSFGTLEMAQAVGDFKSLDREHRRALHVHLPNRTAGAMRQLFSLIASVPEH